MWSPRPAALSCAVTIVLVTGMAACGSEIVDDPEPEGREINQRCEPGELPVDRERGEPADPVLRQELLAMRDDDQAERTGEVAANNDASRADRLGEIIDEVGWPTPDLVGVDGASAAWLIAQHADFDVEFQREVLDLMCAAVAAGDADPTEMAYLEDRVAVNSGEPQIYGTQVGGCEDGHVVPQPIADEERVHQRREQIGLQPLDEYLALFGDCG